MPLASRLLQARISGPPGPLHRRQTAILERFTVLNVGTWNCMIDSSDWWRPVKWWGHVKSQTMRQTRWPREAQWRHPAVFRRLWKAIEFGSSIDGTSIDARARLMKLLTALWRINGYDDLRTCGMRDRDEFQNCRPVGNKHPCVVYIAYCCTETHSDTAMKIIK